jgi:phage shock protein E
MVMKFLKSLFSSPFPGMDIQTYHSTHFGKNDHVLIDVRTPQEFKSGHIPGAKNIPLQTLAAQMGQVPNNKPVIVVCRSGNRSHSACHTLWNAGYTNITNLKGGTISWQMQGHPLK